MGLVYRVELFTDILLNFKRDFQQQAYDLLKGEMTGSDFDGKMKRLRHDFPKARRWIEWWQAADVKSMLFRSRPKRIDDDELCDDVMPDTTNAQESLHRVYYMISYV